MLCVLYWICKYKTLYKSNYQIWHIHYFKTLNLYKIFTGQTIEYGTFATLKQQTLEIYKICISQIIEYHTFTTLKQQTWEIYKICTS